MKDITMKVQLAAGYLCFGLGLGHLHNLRQFDSLLCFGCTLLIGIVLKRQK